MPSSASSAFVWAGGELRLSSPAQLELLRGAAARGAGLRTSVLGLSMAPFIRDGDVVTISPLGSDRRQLGGVIAVSLPGSRRLVIHRAVARVGSSWLVRGDNSPRPDGLVRAADALGRVVRVERGGRTVVVGCGPGRILIALLSRYDLLIPLMACARCARRMVPQRARRWRRSA